MSIISLTVRPPSVERSEQHGEEPRGRPIAKRTTRRDASLGTGSPARAFSGSPVRASSISPSRSFSTSPSRLPPSPYYNKANLGLYSGRSRSPSVGPIGALRDDDAYIPDRWPSEDSGYDDEDEEESPERDQFDSETERNTELNSKWLPPEALEPETDCDPLGEGINVVFAKPEPFFNNADSQQHEEAMRQHGSPLHQAKSVFRRDCCSITVSHGNPAKALNRLGRQQKAYMVGSDLSEESKFALDWAIGMVLRDGDELMVVNIMEDEKKVDQPGTVDLTAKLRNQQEREAAAMLIARQVNSVLQRTQLQVNVTCQAWHARNMRHMMLDLVDLYEPTMLIVGSRGIGQLKGILLGSTSHYLVQRSSVPVMVARRRLKHPVKRTAHLAATRTRVPLAQANIDKAGPGKAEDATRLREEVARDEEDEIRQRERNDAQKRAAQV